MSIDLDGAKRRLMLSDLSDLPADVRRALGLPMKPLGGGPGQIVVPPYYAPSEGPPKEYVPTSNFPRQIYRSNGTAYISSGRGIIGGAGYFVKDPGSVFISAVITGAATTLTVTLDGGSTWKDLNAGTALVVGAFTPPMSVPVVPGDQFDVSAAVNTSAVFVRVLFTPSLLQVGGSPMGAAANVAIVGSATLYDGQNAAVTTTAAALASSQACSEVSVQADPGNTQNVLVGNSTSQHTVLVAGASIDLSVTNVDLIYVKSASGTQTVNWLARS